MNQCIKCGVEIPEGELFCIECSLNPGVDRLTLSVVMNIDKSGNLTDHYITTGVIRTAERMTYDDVTAIIEGDRTLCDKYRHIYSDIMNMYDLSLILMKKRKSGGRSHAPG